MNNHRSETHIPFLVLNDANNLLLLVQTLEDFLGLVSVFVALKVLSLVGQSKGRKVSILLLVVRVLDKNTFCLLLQLKLLLLMLLMLIV